MKNIKEYKCLTIHNDRDSYKIVSQFENFYRKHNLMNVLDMVTVDLYCPEMCNNFFHGL